MGNFNMNVESAAGGGAINNTHMVAFQKETEHTLLLYTYTTVERMKSRCLKVSCVFSVVLTHFCYLLPLYRNEMISTTKICKKHL